MELSKIAIYCLFEDYTRYLGMPPYSSGTNMGVGEDCFYRYMCKTYGKENVDDVIEKLKKYN